MNAINFEERLWSVEIEHHVPNTDGLWFGAVNAKDEKDALFIATNLFEANGLNSVFIDKYVITELIQPGGESDDSRPLE